MARISVIVNTYNAEAHLAEVLRAVSEFDEVVVCDMESTDATLAIAREAGCRIVTFPRGAHNIVEPAREFAIRQAASEWCLVVDADEVVPAALRTYLYRFAEEERGDGLYLARRNYFMGRELHAAWPDYILRFFRRDLTTWPPIIHVQPEVRGRVLRMPRRRDLALIHLANDTISSRLRKTDQYTDNELQRKAGKRYGPMAFVWRPAFRFFKAYVLKGGFRDGVPGLVQAAFEGYYQLVMLAKMREQEGRHSQ